MATSALDDRTAFPSLRRGVTLLSTAERATGALQSLVLDHLLVHDGPAYWVDARQNATTTALARVAPSERVLDRIRVARAFTPFQHYSAVADLPDALSSDASLVVLPDVDWFYDADDLRRGEAEAMLRGVVETAATLASDRDVPVVVTRHGTDSPGGAVADAADAVLECTLTPFGPRFSGDDFETLLFECDAGVQTTLAFWRRVLRSRHAGDLCEPREVTARGSH